MFEAKTIDVKRWNEQMIRWQDELKATQTQTIQTMSKFLSMQQFQFVCNQNSQCYSISFSRDLQHFMWIASDEFALIQIVWSRKKYKLVIALLNHFVQLESIVALSIWTIEPHRWPFQRIILCKMITIINLNLRLLE